MKCLIVVDMQNDFLNGSLPAYNGDQIIDNVCNKINEYFINNNKVIFTLDTHDDKYLETSEGSKLPIKHCIKGTSGWEIHPQICEVLKSKNINEDYLFIEKNTFASLELINEIKDYDDITLIGVCTEICVVSNALLIKANYPNIKITVDKNACRGVSDKGHNDALNVMSSCHIEII